MIIDRISQIIPTSIRYQVRRLYELFRKNSMRKFFAQFINPGDLVFDIGANIGDYADIFLDLGAKVIAVEPQPFCIQKLKHRFNNNRSITIVQKGVADKIGVLPFYLDLRNSATATFSRRYITHGPLNNRNWEKQIRVPVTTLDDLIRQFGTPKLCKIDVEGYESFVLKGLHKPIPVISFEYTKKLIDDTKKCLNYLEKFSGMQLNYSTSFNATSLKLKKWTNNKITLLTNIQKSWWYSGDILVKY